MNYKKIGLRCGLEIHQQLATDCKLFCRCGAGLRDEKPVFDVRRRMNPVAGESGDIDNAAMFEAIKKKLFIYKVYKNESCLVELDEEPPHQINNEALEICLQIALMLNCKVPDEIHVMRKTILDGSNTAGFQRTSIIGMNGWINTKYGKIGITNVCLEEDSCQILGKENKKMVYGLNRLGIPLVEIGTSPDIRSPEQAGEVAKQIGMILRSTGKVKRGIGTIRQDLNVSIKGGARVEIKGVQELRSISRIVEKEAERQIKIIETGKKPAEAVRRALPDGTTKFLRPLPGAARMYPETDCMPIEIEKKQLKKIQKIANSTETYEQKLEKLKKKLPSELANQIIRSDYYDMFVDFSEKFRIKSVVIADTLVSAVKDIQKRKKFEPTRDELEEVFRAVEKKQVSKDSIINILEAIAEGVTIEKAIERFRLLKDGELKKVVEDIINVNTGKSESALMGIIMSKIRGKADGKKVMEMIRKMK